MKTSITAVILSASLALSGNVAMAAATHKTAAATHVTRHVAKVQRRGPAQRYVALPGIFGALFGIPGVYVNSGRVGSKAEASDAGGYDPTFDSPSPSTPIDNSASDEAAAAAAAASEQDLNDSMALTASMAAAEEQNDEANAATLQTEINAGM